MVFLVAGEDSGDAHAAELATALRARDPGVALVGLGGPRMAAAGVAVLHDLVTRSVMGYLGVLRRLPEFARIMRDAVETVRKLRPSVCVGVDYPGFNLRFAARVKRLGAHYCHYVSPQVWAWRPGRVRRMRGRVDRMLTVLPFEAPLYEAAGVPVTYVGHPLVDRLREGPPDGDPLARAGVPPDATVLAVLPGSRPAEVRRGMPVLGQAARHLRDEDPALTIAIPVAKPALRRAIAAECAQRGLPAVLVDGHAATVLRRARAALVTSGTATLEAAVLGTPHAILYKIAPWQAPLPALLLRSRFIGLPNCIAGERVVPEFLQAVADPAALAAAVRPFLRDTPERAACCLGLTRVREAFGPPGAAGRAADAVLALAGADAASPTVAESG